MVERKVKFLLDLSLIQCLVKCRPAFNGVRKELFKTCIHSGLDAKIFCNMLKFKKILQTENVIEFAAEILKHRKLSLLLVKRLLQRIIPSIHFYLYQLTILIG